MEIPSSTAPSVDERIARFLDKKSVQNFSGKIRIVEWDTSELGTFGEAYNLKATIEDTGENTLVINLQVHLSIRDKEAYVRSFAKEVWVWFELNYRHILKLCGYHIHDGQLFLVYQWPENGALVKYERVRSGKKMLAVTLGIARALAHLHSRNIVHSYMKLDNVFVSSDGESLLANFSDACRHSFALDGGYTTHSIEDSGRWQACEIVAGRSMRHTKATDVWAFGMTVYEFLTYEIPYHHLDSASEVLRQMTKGRLPPAPNFSSDPDLARAEHYLWSLCERCWALNPKRRPLMKDLEKEISDFVRMETAQDARASGGTVVPLTIPHQSSSSISNILRTVTGRLLSKCFGRRMSPPPEHDPHVNNPTS